MRLITPLQSQPTLLAGDIATDSARTIKMSVFSSTLRPRPLIYRVRVEWAQSISPGPSGLVDLWITPRSISTYIILDIWVVPLGRDVTDPPPIAREQNTIYTLIRN
ncbi:hypothetical protein MFIFM68171_02544 [Madurella fahalii]|uniref:Uncharacterized protein n=1 Tax=Madurella fahalii TaxID=1157608 RepID=A0ABQ0G3K4_9PEZI